MFVVVPNEIDDAIHAAIDKQLEKQPEFRKHREEIYQDLLDYFDRHGRIPEFSLGPKIKGEQNV